MTTEQKEAIDLLEEIAHQYVKDNDTPSLKSLIDDVLRFYTKEVEKKEGMMDADKRLNDILDFIIKSC